MFFALAHLGVISCTLRYQFGANYKDMALLQVSNDNYFVNIYVDLPQLLFDLNDRKLRTLDCPADLEDFSFGICIDYAPVFDKEILYKALVKEKLEMIASMYPSQKVREKRALVSLVLRGIFSAGIKVVNSYIRYKRTQSIKNSIQILGRSHYLLNDDYLDFRGEMTTVVNGNRKYIENIKHDL